MDRGSTPVKQVALSRHFDKIRDGVHHGRVRQRDRFKKEIIDGEDVFELYPLASCRICDERTRLRCGCEAVVCHLCDCPNDCDYVKAGEETSPMTPVSEIAPSAFYELERMWTKLAKPNP